MKDYSKFIQSAYGFITSYKIVGDEIHVYTVETEKGEPQKYKLNPETIAYVESRLENQYKMVIDNREVIKKDFMNKIESKRWKILFALCLVIISVALIGSISIMSPIPGVIGMLLGACGIVATSGSIVKSSKEFDEEMRAIEAYLANRENIEELSKKDQNITAYLSSRAQKKLSSNEVLEHDGVIEDIFNIDFMDKSKLKDLRKLLLRYNISVGLKSEQVFVNPTKQKVKQSDSKKRVKKK